MSLRAIVLGLAFPAMAAVSLASTSGCTTNAFCFTDCTDQTTSTSSTGAGGGGGTSSITVATSTTGMGGCTGFECGTGASGGMGGMGCNDKSDFTKPENCGDCATDCYQTTLNCVPDGGVTCTPSLMPGKEPGTCSCTECAPNFYDLHMDGKCDYYCIKSPVATPICDNIDHNCDGIPNEGVNFCDDISACGACGHSCVVLHGTPQCTSSAMGANCDLTNTTCSIQSCDCDEAMGPGNCWWNIDGLYESGCPYQCDVTTPSTEICDGIDNNCNGLIDLADPTFDDPRVGVPCYGSPVGLCGTPEHAGVTLCSAGEVLCGEKPCTMDSQCMSSKCSLGTCHDLLYPNQLPQLCNGVDDACTGPATIDVNTADSGGSCPPGGNDTYPCQLGVIQCVNAALTCVGEVDPIPEVCNGIDDNCDGLIDLTVQPNGPPLPPADSVGPCDVPIPPPQGATSPCKAGTKACVGGTVQCLGAVLAQGGAIDTCGVDANCDGVLENQPDLMSDIHNCGTCGNDCETQAPHANWSCQSGACVDLNCANGFWTVACPPVNPPAGCGKTCGYACTFVSQQEVCNGIDDNCNGVIDENLLVPTPLNLGCTSPAANTPECEAVSPTNPGGIDVTCSGAGGWQCSFLTPNVCYTLCPASLCGAECAATGVEICDTLDNNCNGLINENVPNFGNPCASDDAKIAKGQPGDGACRTLGTYVCNGPQATICSAVAANCATLPGGCTELCDGIDNDCDGLVDEPFSNPGTNAAFYVMPDVTEVPALNGNPAFWIYSYEASRPSATTTTSGTGNGYFCTGAACNGVPQAPGGVPLNKTPACSVPQKVPWFNVTAVEVEETCQAAGGHICNSATEWQPACSVGGPTAAPNCTWGYAPEGTACNNPAVANTDFCNLATSTFAFGANGQVGLLATGGWGTVNGNFVQRLKDCYADWSGADPTNNQIFDITGNLRELTFSAANAASCHTAPTTGCVYPLMGGAFTSTDENSAECSFTFYSVSSSFELFDAGFRCCFSSNPG